MRIRWAGRSFACVFLAFAPAAWPAEEPEAVYQKVHAAALAGNLEQMLRYAPAARQAEVNALPAAQKEAVLRMMTTSMPRNYSITSRTLSPDGNRSTLQASGLGASLLGNRPQMMYATIAMLREGGEWKMDSLEWSNTAGNPPPQAAAPIRAAAPAAAAVKPTASAPAAVTLGNAPPACVFKPVMTDEDMERCRR